MKRDNCKKHYFTLKVNCSSLLTVLLAVACPFAYFVPVFVYASLTLYRFRKVTFRQSNLRYKANFAQHTCWSPIWCKRISQNIKSYATLVWIFYFFPFNIYLYMYVPLRQLAFCESCSDSVIKLLIMLFWQVALSVICRRVSLSKWTDFIPILDG